MSSKGQVVLPKSIRDSRGFRAGTEFIVEETPRGILLRPARPFPETTIDQVAGCLKSKLDRPVTLEEMDEGVRRMVRKRYESGRY